jgi:hypothetical protein
VRRSLGLVCSAAVGRAKIKQVCSLYRVFIRQIRERGCAVKGPLEARTYVPSLFFYALASCRAAFPRRPFQLFHQFSLDFLPPPPHSTLSFPLASLSARPLAPLFSRAESRSTGQQKGDTRSRISPPPRVTCSAPLALLLTRPRKKETNNPTLALPSFAKSN